MSNEQTKIDESTLHALLYLSRLSSESINMETLKKQVDQIVGYFDLLSMYDNQENPHNAYTATTSDLLRDDTVVKGLEIKDVRRITSEFLDGYFQVPKVLGDGA